MKSPAPTNPKKRVITIGGGKGGVGKSVVASNLAVTLAQNGSRVVLVDCDLGAANQHVLFGIDRPNAGLQALIDRKIESLDEALTPTALPNLHLVAGTGAAVGAANITHGEKQRVMKRIQMLNADIVIVDVGAGVSFNVLDFFELGAQRLLVVTPQVTSIQTAYSFLKGALLRTLRHHAEKTSELDLLEPAIASKENEKVSRLLARLRDENPEFGESVSRILARFGAQIIGNQVSEPNQAGIFHAVSRMIQDFLGINVPILGYVALTKRIRESINQRRPMMLTNQIDENTKVFRQMAEALLLEDVPLDDLLIEEDEAESPAVAPAGKAGAAAAAALELTPSPRHPAEAGMPGAGRADAATPASSDGNGAAAAAAAGPSAPPASESLEVATSEPEHTPAHEPYARRHQRYAVDWLATLRNETVVAAVRVFEISAASVAIECAEPFEIGQRLALVFDQLPQHPAVAVTVIRRVPRGLVLDGTVPEPVIAAANLNRPSGTRLAG